MRLLPPRFSQVPGQSCQEVENEQTLYRTVGFLVRLSAREQNLEHVGTRLLDLHFRFRLVHYKKYCHGHTTIIVSRRKGALVALRGTATQKEKKKNDVGCIFSFTHGQLLSIFTKITCSEKTGTSLFFDVARVNSTAGSHAAFVLLAFRYPAAQSWMASTLLRRCRSQSTIHNHDCRSGYDRRA